MKICVLGAGHLGKIHINCIRQIPEYELIGVCDIDAEVRSTIEKQYQVPTFSNVDDIIDHCDIIDIVTPTWTHYELAKKAILKSKHVFIEKPITANAQEALQLYQLAEDFNCKIQVGHVERFNPAFLEAMQTDQLDPKFIEGHRLAQFNPRGTDVSVVLDLMIHDLDLILTLVNSEVKQIHANGVAVVSNTPDICNARIEFENGCVANLTASRISLKNMRKLRLFQPSSYVSIDMLEKELQIIRMYDQDPQSENAYAIETARGKKWIEISMPETVPNNAIVEELKAFYQGLTQGIPIKVGALEAYKSVQLADEISKCVEDSLRQLT